MKKVFENMLKVKENDKLDVALLKVVTEGFIVGALSFKTLINTLRILRAVRKFGDDEFIEKAVEIIAEEIEEFKTLEIA
jgi:hypothetical protein